MIKIRNLRNIKIAAGLSFVCASISFAADIPNNHCAVVVASRQTMDEVNEYVAEHGFVQNNVIVYPASNGWLAIGVAVLLEEKATPTLDQWKASGKIPTDSFCTKGSKFKNGIPLIAKKQPQTLFNDGRCAVIVASRQTVDEAKSFIIGNKFDRDKTQIYPTKSGWFAIGINVINVVDKTEYIAKLKQQGKIPDDSYCSVGKSYRAPLSNIFNKAKEEKHIAARLEPNKKVMESEHLKINSVSNTPSSKKIQSQYDFQGHFSDELAVIKKGSKWGFINQQGKEVITPKYDFARPFNEGVAVVGSGGKLALINKKGVLITDFYYSEISDFHDGVTIARQNNSIGVLDLDGDVVIPFDYQSISVFVQGVAFAIKNGKKVMIRKNGDINDDYDHIGSFRQGLAPVSLSDRWGYINRKGEIVIKPQFDYAEVFEKDQARVKKAGKYEYINKKGQVVVPMYYEYK